MFVLQSSLWSVAVGVCGLFVEVETVKFTKHRPDIFPLLLEKEVTFETVSSVGKWLCDAVFVFSLCQYLCIHLPHPTPFFVPLRSDCLSFSPTLHSSLSFPSPSPFFLSLPFPLSSSFPLLPSPFYPCLFSPHLLSLSLYVVLRSLFCCACLK